MIDFTQNGDQLLMRYVPERGSDDWLVKPLEKEEDIPLSGRALYVRQEIYQPEIDDGDYGMDGCYRCLSIVSSAERQILSLANTH
jgi:hypothetical protein